MAPAGSETLRTKGFGNVPADGDSADGSGHARRTLLPSVAADQLVAVPFSAAFGDIWLARTGAKPPNELPKIS